ncbi:hypothetical protein HS088_TW19G00238 [Tripterygium wilfordii]|uniref:Uncharacterized protein n=1 Tax=Tripterygium wilfordii TaxID=458696 RepID=A0A7J7CA72_TRIWF|nr:hypothetical protein HS088_TW19G00238 [Tripterygium wilfordii]
MLRNNLNDKVNFFSLYNSRSLKIEDKPFFWMCFSWLIMGADDVMCIALSMLKYFLFSCFHCIFCLTYLHSQNYAEKHRWRLNGLQANGECRCETRSRFPKFHLFNKQL